MVMPSSIPVSPEVSTPFEMTFGQSVPQRRLTVFFRPILAIPQYIVLYFLGIAAAVVVVLGWFAALFTGRLPDSFARFILGYMRWRGRVEGYIFLLTDRYPPFSLEPSAAYPIDMAVQTGRLNRWAVLFRYFIAIPAAIAVALLYVGLSIFWIVTWVATLIKGRVPRGLFEANAAALRYGYRFLAYFYMLTSFYPADVLGDDGLSGLTPASPTSPPPPDWTPPTGAPPTGAPPTGAPPPPGRAPLAAMPGSAGPVVQAPAPVPNADPARTAPPAPDATPAPPAPTSPAPGLAGIDPSFGAPPPASPGPPAPDPALTSQPPPPDLPPPAVPPYPGPGGPSALSPAAAPAAGWRLVLSPGARKLVVTYFIVGALGLVAYIGILVAITSSSVSTTSQAIAAQNDLITAYNQLGRESQAFSTSAKMCPSPQTSAGTQCLAAADAQLAAELHTYQNTVATIDFPAQVAPQVSAVTSAAGAAAGKLEQLAQLGSDPQAYATAATSAGLATAFQQVDTTTRSLNSALLAL